MKLSDRIRGAGVAPTFCQYADEVAELEQQLDTNIDVLKQTQQERDELKEQLAEVQADWDETDGRHCTEYNELREERDELKEQLAAYTGAEANEYGQSVQRITELEQQLEDYKCDLDEEIKEGVETSKRNIKVRKERDELKAELKQRVAQVRWKCIEIDGLRAENERLLGAIKIVYDWAEAYPLDVFPEPDMQRVATVLQYAELSLDAVSAYNMRHVITRIKQVMNEALAEGKDDSV